MPRAISAKNNGRRQDLACAIQTRRANCARNSHEVQAASGGCRNFYTNVTAASSFAQSHGGTSIPYDNFVCILFTYSEIQNLSRAIHEISSRRSPSEDRAFIASSSNEQFIAGEESAGCSSRLYCRCMHCMHSQRRRRATNPFSDALVLR